MLPGGKRNEHVDFLYDSFAVLIKKWQSEGKIRADMDCALIMAIFASIINIDTRKEEVGIQYFPKILDYLAEFVIKGLTVYR